MITKDTQVLSKLLDNKITERAMKLVGVSLLPIILALVGWLWMTSSKIVKLETKMEADKYQWGAIKKNSDSIIELRVRVGIIEGLSGRIGIEDEAGKTFNVDLEKAFNKIRDKSNREKPRAVREFIDINMQQQSKY